MGIRVKYIRKQVIFYLLVTTFLSPSFVASGRNGLQRPDAGKCQSKNAFREYKKRLSAVVI